MSLSEDICLLLVKNIVIRYKNYLMERKMKRFTILLVLCLVFCFAGSSAETILQSTDNESSVTGPIPKIITDTYLDLTEKDDSSEDVSAGYLALMLESDIEENSCEEEFQSSEESQQFEESEPYEPSEEPEPRITQPKHYFVYNSSKGILSHQGGLDDRIYMASITKLYTARVALNYLSPETEVTVGNELDKVAHDASRAGLEYGDELTVEQLAAGMLLPSGNDAAYVLATAAGRKILNSPDCSVRRALNAFMNEMNRQARVDGLRNTHFANPDGYHRDDHYTSMNDVLMIARLALENELIAKCTSKIRAEVVVGERTLVWENTNLILHSEFPYYRENVIGLKTGYTDRAGHCIIVAERTNDGITIAGIFGCESFKEKFEEAVALLTASSTN